MSEKKKVLLIGLDGATFDVINPLIKEGKLKNIANLIKNGSHCILNSTIPAVSPVAWTSMISGVNPGKHNIYDFVSKTIGEYNFSLSKGGKRGVKTIWSLLSERGYNVGSYNVTMSYPPEKVNGFVISGIDSPSIESEFAYPPEIIKEIKEVVGDYHIVNPYPISFKDMNVKGIFQLIEERKNISLHLIKKYSPDFLMTAFIELDGSQHFYWKYFNTTHPQYNEKEARKYKNIISNAYEKVDEAIGEIIDAFGKDGVIAIASDHGFGPLHKVFVLSQWLEKEGYLKSNRPKLPPLKRFIMKTKFQIKQFLKKILPTSLNYTIVDKLKMKKRFNFKPYIDTIDWNNTIAFCDGTCGNIYINLKGREQNGIVDPADYEKVCDEIIQKLKAIKDPENNNYIVKECYKKDEIFEGKYSESAPDITIVENRTYLVAGNITRLPETKFDNGCEHNLFLTDHNWSGNHLKNGIFIMSGDGIKHDNLTDEKNIADVTPTILYAINELIPNEMSGKVAKEFFENEKLERCPPQFIEEDIYVKENSIDFSSQEEDKIKENLKDLGYME